MTGDTKVRVLKHIAEHEPITVKRMKEEPKIGVGSIYHHLAMLRNIIEQDYRRRYKLNPAGIRL